MTAGPLRAAIYLCISLDRENTRLGVDRHRENAQEMIKRRDWQLKEIYEDNDISGAAHKKRPGFQKLIADIEQGLIDVVVAQEWPRLERNGSEGVLIIEACQPHKVLLAFVKGNDIDTTTAAGRLVADFMSSMARHEIEVKSERQSRAQFQRAEQGRAPKGVRPLGYATNGDVIPDEATAVEKIYKAFAGGSSLRAIALALSGETQGHSQNTSNVPPRPRHTRTLVLERNAKRAEENQQRIANAQLELRSVPEDGPGHRAPCWAFCVIPGMPATAHIPQRKSTPTATGAVPGVLQSSGTKLVSPSKRNGSPSSKNIFGGVFKKYSTIRFGSPIMAALIANT